MFSFEVHFFYSQVNHIQINSYESLDYKNFQLNLTLNIFRISHTNVPREIVSSIGNLGKEKIFNMTL